MTQTRAAAQFAYVAVVCFVSAMALAITQAPPPTFPGAPPPLVIVVSVDFVLFHLALLPVVAALDAPAWAKGSGYAWIAVDNVIVFLSFFGVGADLIIPMRFGIHLAAAMWVFGASSAAGGALRGIGFVAALSFVASSFVGPFVGAATAPQLLGPPGLLLVVWLLMVAREIPSTGATGSRSASGSARS